MLKKLNLINFFYLFNCIFGDDKFEKMFNGEVLRHSRIKLLFDSNNKNFILEMNSLVNNDLVCTQKINIKAITNSIIITNSWANNYQITNVSFSVDIKLNEIKHSLFNVEQFYYDKQINSFQIKSEDFVIFSYIYSNYVIKIYRNFVIELATKDAKKNENEYLISKKTCKNLKNNFNQLNQHKKNNFFIFKKKFFKFY